jgi:hypothetical protein
MKINFIIFFLLVYPISSLLAQSQTSSEYEKAKAYIVRNEFVNILKSYDFYNNDKYIGQLNALGCLEYECDAGKQLFWTAANNRNFLELDLKPGSTYIVEANFKIGLGKGMLELKLVPSNSDNYKYLIQKFQDKKIVQLTHKDIQKQSFERKNYISRSLKRYKTKKQKEINFSCDTINPSPAITKTKQDISPIILDYNFVDFPFSHKSMDLSGLSGLISNPSMSQSLNITASLNSLKREGLFRLMNNNPATKRYYRFSVMMADMLTYFPIPLSPGWEHEEFHRAVLAKHGGNSYNEMNNFPVTKSLISVLRVKDEDLIRLKHESPQDMVRMSVAGIEGEYLLGNTINKQAFYYNTKSISFTPFLSALNSAFYVIICSTKDADEMTDEANSKEGSNVAKRDLVGMDFLSYTYDLFRPNEPYQNRGIHPSGVGVNRYIKRSQLTDNELSYLRKQGVLQLINFLNPMLFFKNSFTLQEKENGDDTRANLYFNHWLSPFGYDISATGLLHYNRHNYAFSLHNYANKYKWFPGIEVETYNYLIGEGKLKHAIPVSSRAMLWLQPKNQLFFAKSGSLGGFIETKVYYPANKHFQPYISVSAKTNGWVQGNVYLERNVSCEFGLRAYL